MSHVGGGGTQRGCRFYQAIIIFSFFGAFIAPPAARADRQFAPSAAYCEAALSPKVTRLHRKPPVTQCGGTCYFEATVSALENTIEKFLDRPVSVSRIALLTRLLEHRFELFDKHPEMREPGVLERYARQGFKTALVHGGNYPEVLMVANSGGLVLGPPKSLDEIAQENHEVRSLLLYADHIALEAPNLDAAIARLREVTLPLFKDEVERFRHFPQINPGKYQITFDEFRRGEWRLNDLLEEIDSALSRGKEVLIGYTHIKDFEVASGPLPGRLEVLKPLPPDKVHPNSGGPHLSSIVGFVRHPHTQAVTHLVLRNAWGADEGDGGYHYMSMAYFRAYVEDISYFKIVEVGPPSDVN